MCYACGSQWPPWSRQIHLAPPPTKEETIYIDDNTQFYPDHRQGIHPPGPVYQTLGPATPTTYTSGMYAAASYPMQGVYGGAGMSGFPTSCNYQVPGFGTQQYSYPMNGWPYTYPYCSNSALYASPSYSSSKTLFSSEPPYLLYYPIYNCSNTYSQMTLTAAPGIVPGQLPLADSPATLTAQAAAAAEHNKQLTNMQGAAPYMVGGNPADMTAQASGMIPGMMQATTSMMGGTGPTTLAPYKPGEANQFWCRETDGAWTLRGYSEICLGDVSPGHWEKHAVSGYFFWVRHLA